MKLDGQIALVTGGSRGIGRAIVHRLGRLGAFTVINYRGNQQAAEESLRDLRALGGNGELSPFDVADETQVEEALKKIVDRYNKIDILVNNAGLTADSLLLRAKPEDWDRVVGTNLKGTMLSTKAAVRFMVRARSGRIINMTSVVGQTGNTGQSLYAASKAGIIGFTKSMAKELAARSITVNAVAPGFIETAMTERLPAEVRNDYRRAIPLGRFGACEDVAGVVAFLAGADASYITGQVIAVNGGLYM